MRTLNLETKRCIYCKSKPLRCDVVKDNYDNKDIKRVRCSNCFKEQLVDLTPIKPKPKHKPKKSKSKK